MDCQLLLYDKRQVMTMGVKGELSLLPRQNDWELKKRHAQACPFYFLTNPSQ